MHIDDILHTVNTLTQEELSLYKKLEKLVDDEKITVENADMESLLKVLEEKQAIISDQEVLLEKWGDVSHSLGIREGRESHAFWDAIALHAGDSGYTQLADRVKEIRALGQRVIDKDIAVQAQLEEIILEMREKLKAIGSGRNALSGYSRYTAKF